MTCETGLISVGMEEAAAEQNMESIFACERRKFSIFFYWEFFDRFYIERCVLSHDYYCKWQNENFPINNQRRNYEAVERVRGRILYFIFLGTSTVPTVDESIIMTRVVIRQCSSGEFTHHASCLFCVFFFSSCLDGHDNGKCKYVIVSWNEAHSLAIDWAHQQAGQSATHNCHKTCKHAEQPFSFLVLCRNRAAVIDSIDLSLKSFGNIRLCLRLGTFHPIPNDSSRC